MGKITIIVSLEYFWMRLTAFGAFNKQWACRIEVLDESDCVWQSNYKDKTILDSLTAKESQR